jgi:hypothetical protein
VGADPYPTHLLAHYFAEGAIVISHANREAIVAALQTAETERGVTGIAPPQLVILDGEPLNLSGQRLEEFPESPGGDGFHFGDGHSRRRPFADSLSASSKRKSSLPVAESAIQLLVPSTLFAETKPLDDAPVFFRGQALDSRLDILNSAHA